MVPARRHLGLEASEGSTGLDVQDVFFSHVPGALVFFGPFLLLHHISSFRTFGLYFSQHSEFKVVTLLK